MGATAALSALAGLVGAAGPATAQVAANVTLASNQIFRGETISADDPGLTLAVSADLPGGLFAGADASFAAGSREPRFTAATVYAGIARKAGPFSLEAGVIHRDYPAIFDEAYRPHYTEFYVGAAVRRLRLRAYVSPDYLADGRATYYAEANADLARLGSWQLEGHGGFWLIPHDRETAQSGFISYEEWGLRASRPLGPFALSLGLVASNYPVFGPSGKARVTAAISRAF